MISKKGLQKHDGNFCTCPLICPKRKRLLTYLCDKEPAGRFLGIQLHGGQAGPLTAAPDQAPYCVPGSLHMDTVQNKQMGHLPAQS